MQTGIDTTHLLYKMNITYPLKESFTWRLPATLRISGWLAFVLTPDFNLFQERRRVEAPPTGLEE
jgi:hypothetical protein